MVVVEVRQGPLEDEEGRKEGRKEGREEGRKEATNIKSNNPHLAGGEKHGGLNKWGTPKWMVYNGTSQIEDH